ncbi:SDR family NAD(P)-dependent oxidoreductase [Mesorhizobium sp. ZMM04-5]|uniref:SDR family NAD(P)-dependent oxidoreductase n=1 Tax=Mesorhizobium marinum TaxID=3228790 RepID=A0ABV3QZC4_9HYPH
MQNERATIDERMKGSLAVVTGAARGQGLEEARLFARHGAKVILADVLETDGEAAAAAMRADGLDVRFQRLDVTDAAQWEAIVTTAREWAGRIDVLVNNAGIIRRKTIAQSTIEDWSAVIGVNLTGAFLGIKAVAPLMAAGGGGAIVNISSNSGFSGHPDPAYTASKWGLRGLARSAALEFASARIRVNSVCPGLVVTDLNRNAPHLKSMLDLTPAGRAVEVSEVASLVYFLASDDAAMITGEDVVIDGGFVMGAAYRKTALDAGSYS